MAKIKRNLYVILILQVTVRRRACKGNTHSRTSSRNSRASSRGKSSTHSLESIGSKNLLMPSLLEHVPQQVLITAYNIKQNKFRCLLNLMSFPSNNVILGSLIIHCRAVLTLITTMLFLSLRFSRESQTYFTLFKNRRKK
jgi:hypothetical protein